jgi:hypothetical protein
MKVQTVILSFLAILTLLSNAGAAKSQGDSAASVENQLWLSPVSGSDNVVPRIYANRTVFIDELDKRYCAEHNPDEAKRRKCIENSRYYKKEFSFFTDIHGQGEYSIGINGKELKLRRISKKPGKPHDYIGSFAGEGVSVEISHPRLVGKITCDPEGFVVDARYKVIVTVKKGALKKTFKGVLWDGM